MEDMDKAGVLREKLLTAGIDEIASHGVNGLSLRRVAAACGASCAAPYKHFKNKDDFINEIILYVDEKWEHLSRQIAESLDDPKERIAQLCIANVKFKLSNPLYVCGSDSFESALKAAMSEASVSSPSKKLFAINALVRGTSDMIEEKKAENCDKVFELLKEMILEIL